VAAEEEEAAMAERRQDLFTLFRNAASLDRPQAYAFVGARLSAALQGGGAAWQDVEVSVSLLYQLGEGAPEADIKPGSGVLAQLAAGAMQVRRCLRRRRWPAWQAAGGGQELSQGWGLGTAGAHPADPWHTGTPLPYLQRTPAQACALVSPRLTPPPPPHTHTHPPTQAEVPAAQHRLVALALLETYVRYARVAAAGGGPALAALAARFLGERGMGHPCEAVARRAAYLFCRLAKQLRSGLRPLLPDILASMQRHLAAIAATPSQEAPAPKSSGVAGGRGGAGVSLLTAVDDRLYAFEAAGLLLGQEEVEAAQQHAWLAALLQPLVAQMEAGTAAAAAGSGGPPPGAPPPALLVQQALEAATRVARGFSLKLCTERPELGALLLGALRAAAAAPRALPAHKPLRARFISFLHRLVECLGDRWGWDRMGGGGQRRGCSLWGRAASPKVALAAPPQCRPPPSPPGCCPACPLPWRCCCTWGRTPPTWPT
jgi:exportin-T